MTETHPQSLSKSLSNSWKIDMDVEVALESYRSKIRLRIPAKVFGEYKYIYTGLPDTEEGRREARKQAIVIEDDIANGELDLSLEKYKPKKKGQKTYISEVPEEYRAKPWLKWLNFRVLDENFNTRARLGFKDPKAEPEKTLPQLWQEYVEFRSTQVAETTLRFNYARISSHLEKCPFKTLDKAIQIRNHLLSQNSNYTAKRVLTQLAACCNWAVESKLVDSNPFVGMAAKVKVQDKSENNIDPFSKKEIDAIVQAFAAHPVYNHYTNFVKFLFLTGCRSSEAVGLKWKHISADCQIITFCEAVVNVSSRGIRKNTKTGKSRKFPCNPQLQKLLLNIRPSDYEGEDLVFTSLKKGREINIHTFNATVWKGCRERGVYKEGIVSKLVREGLVERYRPQYQTRHTFITICVEDGKSPAQVAKWVGNSAEIIMRHYCGTLKQVQVPSIMDI